MLSDTISEVIEEFDQYLNSPSRERTAGWLRVKKLRGELHTFLTELGPRFGR